MTQSTLANKLVKVVQEYESDWQQQIQELGARIESLEKENTHLRAELEKPRSFLDEITDEQLKERLSQLGSPPPDTVIREAGVVLEARLRTFAESGSKLVGVQLAEAVFAPEKSTLEFSSHSGEQLGVMRLYQGAMQFIRNPPMHKLIEYPESTARLLVRLIDSLLQLLSEGEVPSEVNLDDVRRMLTRRRISKGQLELYKALYDTSQGLSMPELVETLNRSRSQIAGVLGALGRRIHNTPGLGGKGGLVTVLDISEAKGGEWHYRMRSHLRQALELENVL